ncbi:MAG: NADH-quinone oxidoreductase subunit N [Tepidisphaeraceae bacterium]|jgi:NADH-quinone oxidoreductase subunit N
MKQLLDLMLPEIILCSVAGLLLLLGVARSAAVRRFAPVLAVAALLTTAIIQWTGGEQGIDSWQTVHVFPFAAYVKLLVSLVGILLVLLAWPANREGTAGPAIHYGSESCEFFGLMLLSIAGVFMVAEANDIMLLFLGIELASIPTYIMVSISRPLPEAQEAGVKYFFLGAMAAAIMLFGFSYLYGTTGTTKLDQIAAMAQPGQLSPWQMLAVVMLIGGFAFKMAVVPLHVYAGDVYQGAATPVTAFLSFIPKTSGFVALLKVLYSVSGGTWSMPHQIVNLLWILAALTMTFGNVLGLVQASNIKRVFAYSSIAHSGYMLVGVTALVSQGATMDTQSAALRGILFYLAAYGLMNVGAFGVLILLPARHEAPATSAETFDDIAGQGRHHLLLSLAMAVSCFSLIGLPLTAGFFGKLYLIAPALSAGMTWLVVILVLNAAVSAAYYLRIVGALFLRGTPVGSREAAIFERPIYHPVPVLVSVGISMIAVLWLGIVIPATNKVLDITTDAAHLEPGVYAPSK